MRRLALIAATALLLAGCTSSSDSSGGSSDGVSEFDLDDSATPSATPTTAAPTGPDCAEVWKAGEMLPADYEACLTDGAYGSQDVTKCQDGTKLIAYLDSFYAVTGGTIVEPDIAPMQDTEEYGAAFSACTGE